MNKTPTGTQPIQGKTVKVEVVDAVDLGETLKVAIRISSIRKERVRGKLQLHFDDKAMSMMGKSIDLQPTEADLAIFSVRVDGGNGSNKLAKLRAELSELKFGN